MSKPVCEDPSCEFEAEHKCNSCGKVFCLKHIASYQQQWICAQDLRKKQKKTDSQKQIVVPSAVAGVIGLVIFMAGVNAQPSLDGSLLCLAFILTTFGFGISLGMGIGLFFAQRALSESLRKLFPEQENIVKD